MNGEPSFSSCVPLGTPSSETIGRTRRPGKWGACLGLPSLFEHNVESGLTPICRVPQVVQPSLPSPYLGLSQTSGARVSRRSTRRRVATTAARTPPQPSSNAASTLAALLLVCQRSPMPDSLTTLMVSFWVFGHVASPCRTVRAGRRRLERQSVRLAGDHQTRQPYPDIVAAGFTVDRRERRRAGTIESVRAFKPTDCCRHWPLGNLSSARPKLSVSARQAIPGSQHCQVVK